MFTNKSDKIAVKPEISVCITYVKSFIVLE